MKRAGVGFREHTGWAAMVALGGGVTAPVVLARSRYELCQDELPRAVYHAARQLDLENAERLVRQVAQTARDGAEWQLRRTIAELEAAGYEVVGTAVAAPRQLTDDLSEILGSHPLVHTAEGQLFRDAFADAAGELRPPVSASCSKGCTRRPRTTSAPATRRCGHSSPDWVGLSARPGSATRRRQRPPPGSRWRAPVAVSPPGRPNPRADQPGAQAGRR